MNRILFPFVFYLLLGFGCLNFFSSCGEKKEKVIKETKLVSLMADMQIANSYFEANGYGRTEEKKELAKGILKKYDITQEELDSTMVWYGRNLDEYSALYEKVDKEIASRRERLAGNRDLNLNEESGNNFWTDTQLGIISPLAEGKGWIISIDEPELQKGDRLKWSLFFPVSKGWRGLLGVEYDDGTSESINSFNNSKSKFEITLQTDTSKTVERIYGSLILQQDTEIPIFADSIKFIKLPFDSIEYRSHRSQKKFGSIESLRRKEKQKQEKDSVQNQNDSIIDSSIKEDNPPKQEKFEKKIKPDSLSKKINRQI